MSRPTQAVIDLAALRQNYALAQQLAPDSRNIPVIKANAYGHGAVAVARALEPEAPAFVVTCWEEALELRAAGIRLPMLVLGGIYHRDELPLAVEHNLWPMLENEGQIDILINAKMEKPIPLWLKVDTGMHRLGVAPEQAAALYRKLQASPNAAPGIVLATHFASADDLNNDLTRRQIQRLRDIARTLGAPTSLANSPALLAWRESLGDWNRPGYMLYGNSPFPHAHELGDRLIPVMSLQSEVVSLRTVAAGEAVGYGESWRATVASRIATIPVGYGDGYPRNAPSGTPVLVNGQRATLAGRVSMDLISVDVTGLGNIAIGSPVELWGKNLSVNEVAAAAGTIGYELLTRVPLRVPRVYQG